uniref:phage shock envelope stress response protein PspM n=1 Tax=Nocardia jejuensis TaxID=328049 RepID=UPI000A83F72B
SSGAARTPTAPFGPGDSAPPAHTRPFTSTPSNPDTRPYTQATAYPAYPGAQSDPSAAGTGSAAPGFEGRSTTFGAGGHTSAQRWDESAPPSDPTVAFGAPGPGSAPRGAVPPGFESGQPDARHRPGFPYGAGSQYPPGYRYGAREGTAAGFGPGVAGTTAAEAPKAGKNPKPGKKQRKRERAAQAVREVLAPAGMEPEELAQRLPDTLREVGEQALVAVRKWADPRERELRKRRRTRRRGLRLGTASGLTTAGTVGLVLISAPAWAVVVVGGGAVALVTGTAVTTRRYLLQRREPLPQAAFVPRKLPPLRSAARTSIARLVKAERALHGLGAQIARSGRLPADDLADTLATATSGAAALHALASDLVAMEHAAGVMGATSPLTEHVRAVSVRLDGGVVEFEGMVGAAARVLAVPESAAIADDLGWAMVHLRDAADRLDGWAQALTDLADDRFRSNR